MATTGNVYGLQDGHVYLKKAGSLNPYEWGGRCMRLDEGTETLGGLTVTTRQNPRGGVERGGVRQEAPGLVSGSLIMKRLQGDTMKTALKSCLWNVDERVHCSGIDRDSPFKWEEITRYCIAKMSDRAISGTSWDADEDAMVTFTVTALYMEDIYRVKGEIANDASGEAAKMLDVDVCQPARCPDYCSAQEECVVVAVTEDDAANAYLEVNLYGGDLDRWTTAHTLTAFGAKSASAVVCLGEFVVVVSTEDESIIYSDDRGTTQVNVTDPAGTTDWSVGGHAPTQIDAIDQTQIVMSGEDGYIFGSTDNARTWETLDAANVKATDYTRIMIARDNPNVIYVIGVGDVIVKSENAGKTWFEPVATPTGTAGNVTALWVINQNVVLVGTSVGEVFETDDGGATWTEQVELPGLTTKANTSIVDISGCGCGVLYLVASDTTAPKEFVFRNVDDGASGRWFEPDDYESATATYVYEAVVCCGPNHAVAVGGLASTADMVLLLE